MHENSDRLADDKSAVNYRGVELAPSTLESLVTWDICGHARREQDRLSSSAYRARDAIEPPRTPPNESASPSP
jgi:hypothetical protein